MMVGTLSYRRPGYLLYSIDISSYRLYSRKTTQRGASNEATSYRPAYPLILSSSMSLVFHSSVYFLLSIVLVDISIGIQ
jgi:hypothetical protein